MLDSLVTFLKILVLGKSITFGADLQSIQPTWSSTQPKQSLDSITGGATLSVAIGLDKLYFRGDITDHSVLLADLNERFPSGTLVAHAITAEGNTVIFNDGNYSISNQEVRLILSPSQSIPKDWLFIKIIIKSKVVIKSPSLIWQNYYL